MAVLADLSAGAHGGPRIHHRARAHACADVYEGGHQHGARFNEGAVAGDGAGDGADAGLGNLLAVVVVELHGQLVVPGKGTGLHHFVGHQTETQKNCLLDPLVREPPFGGLFCHAHRAVVQAREHAHDGFALIGSDRFGIPLIAAVPCGFDDGGKFLSHFLCSFQRLAHLLAYRASLRAVC